MAGLRKAIIMILTMALAAGPLSGDDGLDEWRKFGKSAEAKEMVEWLRSCAFKFLSQGSMGNRHLKTPDFFGRFGMFVTLKKGGKVRGCYGSFVHGSPDISRVLRDYLAGALRRDERSRPLDISEVADAEIIITVTTQPYPVEDVTVIDVASFGVVESCDGKGDSILVPSELRCSSKLRGFSGKGQCQYSAFRAVTIK
jgi:AMMECR1 domain-containing protein